MPVVKAWIEVEALIQYTHHKEDGVEIDNVVLIKGSEIEGAEDAAHTHWVQHGEYYENLQGQLAAMEKPWNERNFA